MKFGYISRQPYMKNDEIKQSRINIDGLNNINESLTTLSEHGLNNNSNHNK